jgi:hypothetical protein
MRPPYRLRTAPDGTTRHTGRLGILLTRRSSAVEQLYNRRLKNASLETARGVVDKFPPVKLGKLFTGGELSNFY